MQEWKNTLLRGSNSDQREKYWTAFQKREAAVQASVEQLLEKLPQGSSRDLVSQFKTAHVNMGQGYAQGFSAFVDSGFDSAAGDAAVKGMDRAPAKLLVEASAAIKDRVKGSVILAQTSYDNAVRSSLVIFSGIALVGLLGAAWLARSVVRQIGGDPKHAKDAVERIASGDMSTPVSLKSKDATSLMASLEDMRVKLTGIVENVRESSSAVAKESTLIVTGSAEQGHRAKQLSESLGATASSMQDLSAAVAHNATIATQADQLSENASKVAYDGGRAVAEVVDTMRDIQESSKKVSDITTVIDGIAFQTNLLALNAAVEAARAGPEGRGFAIVAGEVRALAHRSADAANEIKKLITESVQSVQIGGKLVDQAGTTMDEVVSSIAQVKTLLKEINRGGVEQSSAVQRVDNAVNSMEQAIEQSSIAISENVSAAERLRSQSDQLNRGVEIFKLGSGSYEKSSDTTMAEVSENAAENDSLSDAEAFRRAA